MRWLNRVASRARVALRRLLTSTDEEHLREAVEHLRFLRRHWDKQRERDHEDRTGRKVTDKRFEADLARIERLVSKSVTEIRREQQSLAAGVNTFAEAATLFRGHRRTEERLRRHLAHMRSTKRPIVVGPWTGEVGFELLYWIPFVTWAVNTFDVPPERLIVVSRGGTGLWYRGLADRYIDVFDLITVDRFQVATSQSRKQLRMTELDSEIIAAVRQRLGCAIHLMHPRLMYQAFTPVWKDGENPGILDRLTCHRRIDVGQHERPAGLPSRYVAMKWYYSLAFPETPENRSFVRRVIRQVSEQVPVVLLATGSGVDDHSEHTEATSSRVLTPPIGDDVRANLELQTRIIAGAEAFVGTYGGFSYLAPLLGVATLAFYSEGHTFSRTHLNFAQQVFAHLGAGTFIPLDVRHAALVASYGTALPTAADPAGSSSMRGVQGEVDRES
ncbi:MAG: hypothetical protein AB1806_18230 [Acidobacteriota bacterium]